MPGFVRQAKYALLVGILVEKTLGKRYNFPNKKEVAFVSFIARQYIWAVQTFKLSAITTLHTWLTQL